MLAIFIMLFTKCGNIQNPDYSLDLGEHYDSELHEMPSGYVEAYTVLDAEGNQRYVLSITKVSMSDALRMPDVYGDTYKNAILSKCNCTIQSIEAKNYSYFTGNQFELLRNGQSTYVLSTTQGSNLYSITYSGIGKESTIENYPEFERVMNTLEFYK